MAWRLNFWAKPRGISSYLSSNNCHHFKPEFFSLALTILKSWVLSQTSEDDSWVEPEVPPRLPRTSYILKYFIYFFGYKNRSLQKNRNLQNAERHVFYVLNEFKYRWQVLVMWYVCLQNKWKTQCCVPWALGLGLVFNLHFPIYTKRLLEAL